MNAVPNYSFIWVLLVSYPSVLVEPLLGTVLRKLLEPQLVEAYPIIGVSIEVNHQNNFCVMT